MIQLVDALQMIFLQELHLDVKVQHLCSEVVLLIEMFSPPLFLQFSRLLSSSIVAIWLPLTRMVHAKFPGCMKDVFKLFVMIKVAGTVLVFLLVLNRRSSHKTKSSTACSLTLRPNRNSTAVFVLHVFEVLQCVISALCRNTPNDTLSLSKYINLLEALFESN